METTLNWKFVKKDGNPDHDGWFLAVTHYGVSTYNYSVEGGWNTHIDFNGKLCAEHAMEDERFIAWAEVTDYPKEEDEKW